MAFAESIIRLLDVIGFFDIFLPFLLVYAITYGILYRSQVFGDPKDEKVRGLYGLIALAFAGFVIGSINIIRGIKKFVPMLAFFLIIVLGFVLIATFTLAGKYEDLKEKKAVRTAIGILSLLVFLVIILTVFDLWGWIEQFFTAAGGAAGGEEETMTNIFAIAMFIILGLIIYWIVRPSGQGQSGREGGES